MTQFFETDLHHPLLGKESLSHSHSPQNHGIVIDTVPPFACKTQGSKKGLCIALALLIVIIFRHQLPSNWVATAPMYPLDGNGGCA